MTRIASIKKLRSPAVGRAVLIGFLGIIVSYFALANAISNVTAKSNPERSLLFWQNGEAQLARTDRLLTELDDEVVRGRLVAWAKAAVQDSPLNAGAVRNYALAKMYGDDRSASLRALDVAQRISRRDLGVQLQLATNAAEGNNLEKALQHYSNALSTHVSSHQLIFPVLSQAIGNKLLDEPFAKLIGTKPLWVNDFISFVLAQGRGSEGLARVLRKSNGVPAGPEKTMLEKRIIQALVNDGAAYEVRAFYLSLANADKSLITSTSISTDDFSIVLPPVSWTMTQTSDILTEFDADRQALKTQVAARMSGVVAQKMLFWPPGVYDISMQSQVIGQAPGASLTWTIFCISKAEPLKIIESGITANARIAIDGRCPAQLLEIRAAGGTAADGMVALILGFDVESAGRAR